MDDCGFLSGGFGWLRVGSCIPWFCGFLASFEPLVSFRSLRRGVGCVVSIFLFRYYTSDRIQTKKLWSRRSNPTPRKFPPFRRPLQLRVYPPVGLPIAREGSPRLRAFSPRVLALLVSTIAVGGVAFPFACTFAVSWLLPCCRCHFSVTSSRVCWFR